MGLTFYSLGAIFFWPVAHFTSATNKLGSFGGFLVCTLVIACGLATLETSANSYAVVIGDPATASPRLQFCQSWNGVASFVGPLIASDAFFSGSNNNNLTNVQYVYLAVACAGVAVGAVFFFAKLPEIEEQAVRRGSIITEETLEVGIDQYGNVIGDEPLWKQYNMICGFIAQFCYVGSQVTIASFFINYATENATYDNATASQMFSYGLITFTVGRFIATAIATVLESNFLLTIYACCAIALTAVVSSIHGNGSVGVLIAVFFFMAPMYPTIFTLGTANLGRHTRRGAGILVMGVSGGAVFPPIQGAIADSFNTRISYLVPTCGFVVVLAYVTFHWVTHGMHILRVKGEAYVATSLEGAAVGGGITTTHYDEKRLSVAALDTVRRGSVGTVTIKGVTGGIDKGEPVQGMRRFSVRPADDPTIATEDYGSGK